MIERVHLVGVGGSGMSGLARILASRGVVVSGSDLRDSATLTSLRERHGVRTQVGHRSENVENATLVVASAAVKDDNPEIAAARALGIEVISRAQMLGRIMQGYEHSVAVTGTHGKTTTTGMIATALEFAGLDPTVLIGGDLPQWGGNARLGASPVFVTEACEAYDSFLDLQPRYAVITNIEADHLDYYGDLGGVLRSFRQFLSQVGSRVFVHEGDKNIHALRRAHPEPLPEFETFGLTDTATMRAIEIEIDSPTPSFSVFHHGKRLGSIQLLVPGIHNVVNALAAISVGITLGAPFDAIAGGLAQFTGAGRRFELLGETSRGVLVVDDYAHHPTEIRATLAAARHAYPDRRIVAAFQPHLPSRTRDFLQEFAESFGDADHVVLTDIYLAREAPLEGVTGAGLAALTADRRGPAHVTYVPERSTVAGRLLELTRPGDLLVTLGAGADIRQSAEEYLNADRGVSI